MQALYTTTITNADCRNRLGFNERFVHEYKICTFTQAGQGTCTTDNGSPLTTGTGANAVQIGIVSWQFFPCARGDPDGYNRISWFREWIVTNAQ